MTDMSGESFYLVLDGMQRSRPLAANGQAQRYQVVPGYGDYALVMKPDNNPAAEKAVNKNINTGSVVLLR